MKVTIITGSPHKKGTSALLATAYDSNAWTMQALTAHYETLARYMHWQDSGRVLAVGCGARSDIERSRFPQDAYQLGRLLK